MNFNGTDKKDEWLRCNVCNLEINILKVNEHVETPHHRDNKTKLDKELSKYLTNNNGSESTIVVWFNSILPFIEKNNIISK